MTNSRATSLLKWGLSLTSPLLFALPSCETTNGGIVLPPAGSAGMAASGGTSPSDGGSGGQGVEGGEAGAAVNAAGAAGQDDALSGKGGSAGKGSTSGKGGSTSGKGGTHSTGGTHASGGTTSSGGSADDGGSADEGGMGGSSVAGTGGSAGMSAGSGNSGGVGGLGGTVPVSQCIFHNAPASGGEGGAAPAPNGVKLATNPFVGPYLTDLAGLALYIYGADFPGDCNNPPISNCIDDCVQSWPLFDAGERTLDPGLDPDAFGTIVRGDGLSQTTYLGWPLYRYKTDTTAGTINGQGKSKTWFAAEVELPNLMIMRGPVADGGLKYLGDDHGHTLYALSGDTLGGAGILPVSACTGSCLDSFTPFAPGDVYPVTTLEPHDIALFFRGDGTLQTAYKGAPLYFAKGDTRSGQTTGVALLGGALVAP